MGGFVPMRVTSDLKKLSKTLPRILRRGEFLKGPGRLEEQMSVPILVDEQVGQLHLKMLEQCLLCDTMVTNSVARALKFLLFEHSGVHLTGRWDERRTRG